MESATTTTSGNKRENLRWIILMLNCILLIGNYYAYDLPSALAPLLRPHLNQSNADFDYLIGLFYSVYSFPNIILPFISGHLIEVVGVKHVLIWLSVCVCLGQLLFFVGCMHKNIALMIAGRLVFGFGGESVAVAQSCITTYWFQNKELAFALGLNLAVPRVGTVMNALISPAIGSHFSVDHAVFFGFLMCIFSLFSALILALGIGTTPDGLSPSNRNQEVVSISAAAGDLVDEPPQSRSNMKHTIKEFIKSTVNNTKSLPSMFWLLCVIVMLVYGTIVPFNNIIMDFMLYKWFPGDNTRAGQMMGIPDTLCACLVAPCGYFVDRFGRRAALISFTTLMIAGSHLSLALVPNTVPIYVSPVMPLVILGVAYSIYGVAYWSSIACLFTVDDGDLTLDDIQVNQTVVSSFSQHGKRTISSLTDIPIISRDSFSSLRTLSTTTLPLLAASRAISLPKPPPSAASEYVNPDEPVNYPLFKAFPSPVLRRAAAPRVEQLRAGNLSNSSGSSLAQSPVSDNDESRPLLQDLSVSGVSHSTTARSETNNGSNNMASQLAIAYGVSSSAMNLSLTLVPIIVAAIRGSDSSPTFVRVELFFVGVSVAACLCGLLALFFDYRHYSGGRLEASHYVS